MNSKFSLKLSSIDSGQVLTIHAKAKSDAKNIDIELTEAEDDKYCAEIPFHLSVRFTGSGKIVRNNKTKASKWGKEETTENLVLGNEANPLNPGDDFKVSIYIDIDNFYVSINGNPFCFFKHRKDCKKITRLNVTNDFDKVYRVENEKVATIGWPGQTDTVFRLPVLRKIKINDVFLVKGVICGSDKGSFAINIFDQELKRQYLNVTANLGCKSFRLSSQNANHSPLEDVIVKPTSFPMELNFLFKIAIVVNGNSFTFVVNGHFVASIPFKETIDRIFSTSNAVEIISKGGTKVEVKCFEHIEKEKDCENFDEFLAKIIF